MGQQDSDNTGLALGVEVGDLELMVPASDLEFKVQVPAGCVIVAALRLPSGQLIELVDLVAEDAAGIPVQVPGRELTNSGVGPVVEEKVKAAKDAELGVRAAVKGPGGGKKHALASLIAPGDENDQAEAIREHVRTKMVVENPSSDPEDDT